MKDFKYYSTNKYEYPRKSNFMTIYGYKNGELIWKAPLSGWKSSDYAEASVTEKSLDVEAYKKAHANYWDEHNRLMDDFREDIFKEFDVENNPKREKCFSLAWEHGHSSGFSDVYYYFADLVELIK